MPKRSKYTPQGELIMRCATYHQGIRTIPEMAKLTGIPYQKLYRRITKDFGMTTADELKALIRAGALTDDEIVEVMR